MQTANWLRRPARVLIAPLLASGICGTGLAQSSGTDTPPPAPSAPTPISILLDQANYWHQQGHDEQALEALRRALVLEPRNADALYQSALMEAELGHRAAAQATLIQLRAVRPDDPRVPRIEQALRIGPIDPAGLAGTRRERLGALGVSVDDRDRGAGEHVADHLEVAVTLDSRSDDRHP